LTFVVVVVVDYYYYYYYYYNKCQMVTLKGVNSEKCSSEHFKSVAPPNTLIVDRNTFRFSDR